MSPHRNHLSAGEIAEVSDLLSDFGVAAWVRSRATLEITFMDRGVERMLGYPARRFVEQRGFWESILHPEDRVLAMERLRHAAAAPERAVLRYRVLHADGTTCWVADTISARTESDKRLLGVLALVDDSADMFNAPGAEAVYRRIVEECPRALGVHRDGHILYVNTAAAKLMCAESTADLVGRDFSEFLVPGEREPIVERARHVQRGEREVRDVEEHFRRVDGAIIDVEVTSVPYVFRGQPAVLTLVNDITRRKRGEEAQELLAAAFRASRDAIVLARAADDVVIAVNPAWEELTQRPPIDTIGHTTRDVGLFGDATARERFQSELAQRGWVRDVDLSFALPSGDVRHALVSAERVSLSDEPHILYVVRDLTEQRQLEDQQRQSQKLEAVGRLAGGIAHDFNNLLAVISTYTQLIEGATAADDERQQDLREIRAATDRAAALVRQLLTFSRRTPGERVRVDLAEAVRDMVRMIDRVFPREIVIENRSVAAAEWVLADRGELEQVVMNLAVNARDAMPEGGTLSLEVSHLHVAEPYASRHVGVGVPEGDYVMLCVSDTGVGMDEVTRERVFEPFFSTKAPGQGTGLGLSTAYGIIKRHGGYISLETAVGKGTTFRVYLPRSDESQAHGA